MNDLPSQADESRRLSRLASYRIMDTTTESETDRIVRVAAHAAGTPMAAVAVLDHGVPRLKASIGISPSDAAAMAAACGHWQQHGLERSEGANPTAAVAGVQFYAGVPLRMNDGTEFGFLCVIDTRPRGRPTEPQLAMLGDLAALLTGAIERDEAASADTTTRRPAAAPDGAHRNLLAAYAAKSEFLSSLSHELRTPLNAIVGYAGLIAGSDDTPPATADHAGEITAAARHMLALVNDILEYSRLEAGNLPIGWQRVMVGPIVEAALHMVAVFATSRGIRLTRDLRWADAAVLGDQVRLKQVLLNLLTNAIKFTPRGGEVTVRLAAGPEGEVELAVIDTGIGIAAEDIQKTLTPFGQIVPKEGAQTEGTGLGLPIAKALVERQNGRLILDSKLGHGTTVRIQLPVLARAGNAARHQPGQREAPGGQPAMAGLALRHPRPDWAP